MPTYDLVCDSCGARFETFLMRILRTEDKVCPACGSTEVREGIGGGYVAAPSQQAASGGLGCTPRGGFG